MWLKNIIKLYYETYLIKCQIMVRFSNKLYMKNCVFTVFTRPKIAYSSHESLKHKFNITTNIFHNLYYIVHAIKCM